MFSRIKLTAYPLNPPRANLAAQGGTKIAAIDLVSPFLSLFLIKLHHLTVFRHNSTSQDGTMITRKSNSPYGPRDADDWRWLSPHVLPKIQELHASGHQILIVSNQGAIKGALTGVMSDKIRGVVAGVLAALEAGGVPAQAILATKNDENRKPEPGMWNFFAEHLNAAAVPDVAASFFVGDAAGRPTDINGGAASDKEFAARLGLAFHTPDDFFGVGQAATGANSGMAAAFQELGQELRKAGEGFKASAFLKVATAILEFPTPITSSKDLKGVPGVGKSSQAKVDEYLATGKIAAIDDLKGVGAAPPAAVSKAAAEAAKFI